MKKAEKKKPEKKKPEKKNPAKKKPKAEFFNKGEHYEEDDNRFYRQRQRN